MSIMRKYDDTSSNYTTSLSTSYTQTIKEADKWYMDGDGYKSRKTPVKTKGKKEQEKSLLSKLISKKLISGSTLVFAPQKSPCLSDTMFMTMSNKVEVQIFDPLLPYGDKEPYIEGYDFVIIADLLEKLPDMMSKANIVKEALVSLRTDSSRACVILAARNRQTVEEMGQEEKDKLKMIQGIDADELESIATFAGSKSVWNIKELKEEGVSYIGASFRNRKQS